MVKKGAILIAFLALVLCNWAFGAMTQAALPAAISVSPSRVDTTPWQTFTVNITVDPKGEEILGAQYELYFNPRMLQVDSQTQGGFLSQDGANTMVVTNSFDNSMGKTIYGETRSGVEHGVNNSGTLASITFKTRYIAGNSTLDLKNVILINASEEECSNIEINDGLIENEITPELFSVCGYVFYDDGSECDNPTVKITNLNNTNTEWTANTKPGSNYYQCNLTKAIDVSDEEILLFKTTSLEEEQTDFTYHEITRAEINNSGIFNFNISLEPVRHDINISTDYYPPRGIKIERNGAVIPQGQSLTVGNRYSIKYKVENDGNVDVNVNITVKVANESWESILNDYNMAINASTSYEGNDSWDSSGVAPGSYNIIVNASIPADEHPENNERQREVKLEMPPVMSVDPHYQRVCCGRNFTVNITVDPMDNEICGADYILYFDPNVLNALSQTKGTFLGYDGTATIVYRNKIDNSIGKTEYGEYIAGVGSVTTPGVLATITFEAIAPGVSYLNLRGVKLINDSYLEISALTLNGTVEAEALTYDVFDTCPGSYPSIPGTHHGTITPNVTVHNVSKLYTYPCPGTSGHAEYVAFYHSNETIITEGRWNGYESDWHNISFQAFTMHKNQTYYYKIKTGSYPQIHHTDELEAEEGMGTINCTSFVDANGKSHNNWIPAIRLEGGSI